MGLPARLVSWELDSRQHLLYGRECRSLSLVCEAGAQDVCAITLLKSLRPIHSSLSFHGERSGHLRCPASSVWRRSSPIANSSGKEQAIEQVWEEYFADPSQWWDTRVDKASDARMVATQGFCESLTFEVASPDERYIIDFGDVPGVMMAVLGRWHINFGGAHLQSLILSAIGYGYFNRSVPKIQDFPVGMPARGHHCHQPCHQPSCTRTSEQSSSTYEHHDPGNGLESKADLN